ncbi:MAG: hypothetical protein JWM99_4508 [Verrucomicrobiales bacterium]|nr:hypothetical protein [Verrucomicrobiales bacterium]
MNSPEFRHNCAQKLEANVSRLQQMTSFVGFDGFVDEIVQAVDKRESALSYQRLPVISDFSDRIAAASGRSTNIELVNQLIKLGGNGPIMANALAALGLKVNYLGALGYPQLHPVFRGFSQSADVFSIAEPGHTDAVEFEDGKVMLVKSVSLNEITWPNIKERFGAERFGALFGNCDLVAFVNWTMIPFMSDIWQSLIDELCPHLEGPRRTIFFDLADPEKRPLEDISRALALMLKFQEHFDVILGLNEKEACEIGVVLGLKERPSTVDGLCELALEIQARVPVETLVVHPVTYALAVTDATVSVIEGPKVRKPLITTGAGDHFNSGFCLGKLLGLTDSESLLTGVTTSGFYVGNAKTPGIPDLSRMMQHWPV